MSTAFSIPDYFVIVNPFSDTVNNLGATLDSTNVLNLVRTAKFERRGISSIGNLLATKSTALNNRKQRVKVGTTLSEHTNVTSGVHQGSCIGPLLFILYVNDLTDYNFDCNTFVSLYADDTKYLPYYLMCPNVTLCRNTSTSL